MSALPRKKKNWRESLRKERARASPVSIKFRDKIYKFTDLYPRKFQAKEWAKRYRKQCINARIVKTHEGKYAIYTRRKKNCKI